MIPSITKEGEALALAVVPRPNVNVNVNQLLKEVKRIS